MTYLNRNVLITVLSLLFCAPWLQAAEENIVDQTMIGKWIEQLDADSLTKRQEARSKLIKAEQLAIPALAKAALSDKRELITQSIDILAEIAKKSDDAETQKAARVTLEMLAESDNPSTADRAKLALQTEKDSGIQAFPGWDQPGGEFAGNSSVNRSVSVSNINGMKTIVVKEAGKTTTIQDQGMGAIGVRVTGEGQPKQFKVASLEELKKKDPVVFALYEQYGRNAGGQNFANIGFGGFGFSGGLGNNRNIVVNGVQANGPGLNGAGAIDAKQMMIQQLSELKNRMAGNPAIQQVLDQQIRELQQ